MYVEALIGPETINTVPLDTFEAFRDHGLVEPRLEQHVDTAREMVARLPELDIDLDQVTGRLSSRGYRKVRQAF